MSGRADKPLGYSLDALAGVAGLDRADLEALGVTQIKRRGAPAVRFSYRDEQGVEVATRYQVSPPGPPGKTEFEWKSGSSPCPFGLSRLREARAAGRLLVVEGELDALVLFHHGVPAVGLPDGNLDPTWVDHFIGIAEIALVGTGPDALAEAESALAARRLPQSVRVIELDRDIAQIRAEDPAGFKGRLDRLLEGGVLLAERERARTAERREQARGQCEGLLLNFDILGELERDLEAAGAAGIGAEARIAFLCVTSRLLPQPVSRAVKGPSSAGKSFLVESVLKFFPESAYHALSGMSEKALIYSPVDLRHRHLVITEAAGIGGEIASYVVRSILSEGRLRWETAVWGPHGGHTQLIEKEGPTGLIVTTTAVALDHQQETRMLSITVADTPDQTRSILRALAADNQPSVEFDRWHALQEYLAGGPREVSIPYGRVLAEAMPPVAVRLRRDFRALLDLVRAHALLYQDRREQDDAGRIVATVADYGAVRDLVAGLLAEGVERTVSRTVRKTVDAVERLIRDSGRDTVTVAEVADALQIDRSAAARRVNAAERAGYLENTQTGGRGRKKLLKLGERLPEDQELLPPMDELALLWEEAKAREADGDERPRDRGHV